MGKGKLSHGSDSQMGSATVVSPGQVWCGPRVHACDRCAVCDSSVRFTKSRDRSGRSPARSNRLSKPLGTLGRGYRYQSGRPSYHRLAFPRRVTTAPLLLVAVEFYGINGLDATRSVSACDLQGRPTMTSTLTDGGSVEPPRRVHRCSCGPERPRLPAAPSASASASRARRFVVS